MRLQFQLSEEDEEGLKALGLEWETLLEAGSKWLVILDYPVPPGYNTDCASLALRIPPSYPDDQIDMAYFSPPLNLVSGRVITALSILSIDGKQYQQWSRHRTPANPWRPGLDNIGTHLIQANTWLERELGK
jgi:hypothetical protein